MPTWTMYGLYVLPRRRDCSSSRELDERVARVPSLRPHAISPEDVLTPFRPSLVPRYATRSIAETRCKAAHRQQHKWRSGRDVLGALLSSWLIDPRRGKVDGVPVYFFSYCCYCFLGRRFLWEAIIKASPRNTSIRLPVFYSWWGWSDLNNRCE
jgi:hypothetical protein